MMLTLATKFMKDDGGAAAAEYAVLVALILAALVAALGTFDTALTNAFTNAAAQL